MIKVLSVIGTRPEVIKTAILHKLLLENQNFELTICATGQHKTIFEETLSLFELSPDIELRYVNSNLPLMQRVTEITADLDTRIRELMPDFCIIQGDTLSGYSAAQAAFMNKIPLVHIEAGLRSHDMQDPYPEEMYRHFIDSVSDVLLAPTYLSKQNLIKEQINSEKIFVTGNTSIDALKYALEKIDKPGFDPGFDLDRKINQVRALGKTPGLITIHRRANWGEKLQLTLLELDQIAQSQNLYLFYCMHPNPEIHMWVKRTKLSHIDIYPPLPYFDFIWMLKNTDLVFSDSGGIQEECAYLNKPVVVLRSNTERPEGISHGGAVLWQKFDVEQMAKYISAAGSAPKDIYGDGSASAQIVKILENKFLSIGS
ncbi:MAG: UDP-N-acetylglucosamine 2-epimerase (non-hydrolyzing) [Saprospiraceae bacterium]|nr:UDP-N-acetylglucosamine 2-epimerase (non-hydrolyzing) [Saprospiraceae bacterium]